MEPITAADFHDIVGVDEPAIHPDGDRVAYVRTAPENEESYATTIHLADLETGEARPLTVESGSDSQPRWSPDGETLAFVSDRLTDDDRPQLWLLPMAGGEARQVTTVPGGVASIKWSPDGRRITFTQQVTPDDREEGHDVAVPEDYDPPEPDPRVIDRTIYRANQRYFDRRREQVYLLDVDAETVEPVSEWDDTDHRGPVWGGDGTIYYVHRIGDDPDDSLEFEIVSVDPDGGDPTVVATVEGFVGGLTATTDGQVVFAHTPAPRPTIEQTDLVRLDVASGSRTVLTDGLDRTVSGAPRLGDDEATAYVPTPDTGGVVIRSVPLEGGEVTVLTDPDATAAAFDVTAGRLAYVQSEWDHPGDLFVGDVVDGDRRRVTSVNADLLEERAVAEPEERWFEAPDGEEIQGWVLTPPEAADADAPYPVVLEIHGGPHVTWTTSGTMWHEFQALAGAGYAVVWTNPRGSAGYGRDFAAAIERDWGDTTHGDLMAALDATLDRDDVAADQQFVTGGSFGGYQTAWTIGTTDRFRAAVSQRGVYDLASFYGTSDAYILIESEFDATPWEAPEFLYERSPTSRVEAVDTPTLLLHSERDYRTPVAGAEMFYRALRKLEVPTRFVRYPREGHELSRSGEPGHRVDRLERIIRWFDGYADDADVTPALERDPNAGLSIASDEGTTSD